MYSNAIFRLDHLFDSLLSRKAFASHNIVNHYPLLEEKIIYYMSTLNKVINSNPDLNSYMLQIISGFCSSMYYHQTIHLKNGDFYNLVWDIDSIHTLIKSHKPEIKQFDVDKLYMAIDTTSIKQSHLQAALANDNPVFIAICPKIGNGMLL